MKKISSDLVKTALLRISAYIGMKGVWLIYDFCKDERQMFIYLKDF